MTDLAKIETFCQSLVGTIINLGYTLILPNGEKHTDELKNCNIVGDAFESILYKLIKSHVPTFEKGPKQASADYINKNMGFELKCGKNCTWDVSNFYSFIKQLSDNLHKKMYKTKYLIFMYTIEKNHITITNFKMCNVWDIIKYDGKNPISLQNKKNVWYNIRPGSFNDMNDPKKTPEIFIQHICKAIELCPNSISIETRDKLKSSIMTQFDDEMVDKVLDEVLKISMYGQ